MHFLVNKFGDSVEKCYFWVIGTVLLTLSRILHLIIIRGKVKQVCPFVLFPEKGGGVA